jgi:phosphatidylserine decarboxylase
MFAQQHSKQGKLYDSTDGALQHIRAFINTYQLKETLTQLIEPDPTKYRVNNRIQLAIPN